MSRPILTAAQRADIAAHVARRKEIRARAAEIRAQRMVLYRELVALNKQLAETPSRGDLKRIYGVSYNTLRRGLSPYRTEHVLDLRARMKA